MFWMMFRPIPDFPTYWADPSGRIWRVRGAIVRVLKARLMPDYYVTVGVQDRSGKFRKRLVHRLIIAAFLGPIPDGMESCHHNGIRDDNRLSNLGIATHIDNEVQKLRHGVAMERRLTPTMAARIKHVERGSYREIAARYGIDFRTVGDIRHGRTWKHL